MSHARTSGRLCREPSPRRAAFVLIASLILCACAPLEGQPAVRPLQVEIPPTAVPADDDRQVATLAPTATESAIPTAVESATAELTWPTETATPATAESPDAAATTRVEPSATPDATDTATAVAPNPRAVAAGKPALASPTPPERYSTFDVTAPFFQEALSLRARRTQTEPELSRRIDAGLNVNRISFLLLGCGETYEAPLPVDYICSPTHIVLEKRRLPNGVTRTLYTIFSYTHDIRSPEIERFRGERPGHKNPVKIDQIFRARSFEKIREVFENASGLYIDYPIVIEDVIIKNYVDQVPGTLTVDSPWELATQPVVIAARKYEGTVFPAGRNVLNGRLTLQYLKGLEPSADRLKEPNRRKNIVLQALLTSLDVNKSDAGFWVKNVGFLLNLSANPNAYGLYFDVDVLSLLAQTAQTIPTLNPAEKLQWPRQAGSYYIVDSAVGDGGVIWVRASPSPIIQKEIDNGVYEKTTTAFAVPTGNFVDPYADNLVTGYWTSVREFIRRRLNGN